MGGFDRRVVLTNTEVRAYRTKSEGASLRLKTVLLLRLGWRFSLSYLERIGAFVEIDEIGQVWFEITCAVDSEFGGAPEINPVTMWLSARIDHPFDRLRSTTTNLGLEAEIDTLAQHHHIKHQQPGVLRPIGL